MQHLRHLLADGDRVCVRCHLSQNDLFNTTFTNLDDLDHLAEDTSSHLCPAAPLRNLAR